MNEELKPCPFCGWNAKMKKFNGDKLTYDYEIWCEKCGLQASFGVGYKGIGYKETIEAWNRRDNDWKGAGGKSMTNGDKIRHMSDDDLAGWVLEKITECEVCPAYHTCDYAKSCKDAISKWLKEEADEDGRKQNGRKQDGEGCGDFGSGAWRGI